MPYVSGFEVTSVYIPDTLFSQAIVFLFYLLASKKRPQLLGQVSIKYKYFRVSPSCVLQLHHFIRLSSLFLLLLLNECFENNVLLHDTYPKGIQFNSNIIHV